VKFGHFFVTLQYPLILYLYSCGNPESPQHNHHPYLISTFKNSLTLLGFVEATAYLDLGVSPATLSARALCLRVKPEEPSRSAPRLGERVPVVLGGLTTSRLAGPFAITEADESTEDIVAEFLVASSLDAWATSAGDGATWGNQMWMTYCDVVVENKIVSHLIKWCPENSKN
jgi:hypothetical protein